MKTRKGRSARASNIFAMPLQGDDNSDTGRVPVFGTWRAIYASVIVANIVVMVLIYIFSLFSY